MGPYNLINCNILFFICGINNTTGINAKFFHQGMYVVILANKNDVMPVLSAGTSTYFSCSSFKCAMGCLSSKGL